MLRAEGADLGQAARDTGADHGRAALAGQRAAGEIRIRAIDGSLGGHQRRDLEGRLRAARAAARLARRLGFARRRGLRLRAARALRRLPAASSPNQGIASTPERRNQRNRRRTRAQARAGPRPNADAPAAAAPPASAAQRPAISQLPRVSPAPQEQALELAGHSSTLKASSSANTARPRLGAVQAIHPGERAEESDAQDIKPRTQGGCSSHSPHHERFSWGLSFSRGKPASAGRTSKLPAGAADRECDRYHNLRLVLLTPNGPRNSSVASRRRRRGGRPAR